MAAHAPAPEPPTRTRRLAPTPRSVWCCSSSPRSRSGSRDHLRRARRSRWAQIQPFFVPLLLLLSAAKFALVAMYYMHLKQDSSCSPGCSSSRSIIATVVILAMIVAHGLPLVVLAIGRLMLLPFVLLLDERPRPTGPYEWAGGSTPASS